MPSHWLCCIVVPLSLVLITTTADYRLQRTIIGGIRRATRPATTTECTAPSNVPIPTSYPFFVPSLTNPFPSSNHLSSSSSSILASAPARRTTEKPQDDP